MNAFVEYQVFIISIILLLMLYNQYIHNRNVFKINIILSLIFLLLALERSPIIMLFIWAFIWKVPSFSIDLKRMGKLIVFILFIFVSIFYFYSNLYEDEITGIAFQRIVNVITFNFGNDAAFEERENVHWKFAWELSKNNYIGIGPGTVAPSASQYIGYVGPHNNFLAYHLAYGLFGLMLFICFLMLILKKFSNLNKNIQLFGYGMFCAYFGMAIFNMPFVGKNGILFFIIVGFLFNNNFNIPQNTYRAHR